MEPSPTFSTAPGGGDTGNPDDPVPTEQPTAPDAQGPKGYEYSCGYFAAGLTAFIRPTAPGTAIDRGEDTNKCVFLGENLAPLNRRGITESSLRSMRNLRGTVRVNSTALN